MISFSDLVSTLTPESMIESGAKFGEWCEYLYKIKPTGVASRIYFSKTREVLIYSKSSLSSMSVEELTEVLELEETKQYDKWSDIVGLKYEDIQPIEN